MKFSKKDLRLKTICGYSFSYFEDGVYTYSKQIFNRNDPNHGKWLVVQCGEKDFENGNLEYFMKHDITLNSGEIAKIKQQYKI